MPRFSRTLCAYCCESFERRYKTEGFCCLEHRLLAHTFVPYGKEKRERCWIWARSKNSDGYGLIRVDGIQKYAHCVAYELFVGPIPQGKQINHTCHNPSCVNPAHLYAGTQQENMADKVRAGRQARGQNSGRSRLTDAQARTIRASYAGGGITQKELAAEFNVDQTTISKVIRGVTYRHLA